MKFAMRLKPSSLIVDLTPLVDVVFLLLIFFIVTSDILPLKSLAIENPSIDKDSTPLTTQLLLVMDKEEIIYLGSKKSIEDFSSLRSSLVRELQVLKEAASGHDPTLVVSIDRRVEYGAFLKLFSIVQECCSKIRLVYHHDER